MTTKYSLFGMNNFWFSINEILTSDSSRASIANAWITCTQEYRHRIKAVYTHTRLITHLTFHISQISNHKYGRLGRISNTYITNSHASIHFHIFVMLCLSTLIVNGFLVFAIGNFYFIGKLFRSYCYRISLKTLKQIYDFKSNNNIEQWTDSDMQRTYDLMLKCGRKRWTMVNSLLTFNRWTRIHFKKSRILNIYILKFLSIFVRKTVNSWIFVIFFD